MDRENWHVVGHDWAVHSLQEAVRSDELSHAYLFTGPPGVGKTTVARALAAALLCPEPDPPCGTCRACRLVAEGTHPDLSVLESEHVGANLKIDQVRELEHQLVLTPVEAAWRVAILHRFQEATTSAANALLKTLEEPPSYVVLIILADDADHLLPTIVSRCQLVPLRPLPIARVERALVEEWQAEPDRAALLAHLSGGRLGWAVRMLKDESSLVHRAQRLDELDELLGASTVERFRYAERLARKPVDTQRTLDLWMSWWRDVMLVSAEAEAALTNVDLQRQVRDHACRFGVARSAGMISALREASDRLSANANARLTLEVLMLDLPQA